tara:strand:- start:157 stop:363 length:207 start_codon:yes stop_codon:yes gene_type:complete
MKNLFRALLNLLNLKEKSNYMTIAELKAFNLRKEKIEKEKRSRAYISEINKRNNKMRKSKKNFFRKAS